MNAAGVNPLLTFVFSIAIFILALFGIGDFEFGRTLLASYRHNARRVLPTTS